MAQWYQDFPAMVAEQSSPSSGTVLLNPRAMRGSSAKSLWSAKAKDSMSFLKSATFTDDHFDDLVVRVECCQYRQSLIGRAC